MRAIADAVPAMNNTYVEGADGKPRLVDHEHVSLGIAVDVDEGDGTRTLMVPEHQATPTRSTSPSSSRRTTTLIRKVRNNKLTPDDFAGTTVTLTNPGTHRHRRSRCRG